MPNSYQLVERLALRTLVLYMLDVLNAARKAGLRVFYALHHCYRPGDYESWKYIAPIQKAAWSSQVFAEGTWGGKIRPEFEPTVAQIVAAEHWCSSGFANTDLDLHLEKAWDPPAHRHRSHRTHVCGGHCSLRR